MKTTARFLTVFAIIFVGTGLGHAQCGSGCLTSFSLSTGSISGDRSDYASGAIQLNWTSQVISGSMIGIQIQEQNFGSTEIICAGGVKYAYGCSYPLQQGMNYFSFDFNGSNSTGSTENGNITVTWDVTLSRPISVTSAQSPQEPPSQDPNAAGHCPDCGSGGGPINFANGNTWIPQRDYSIPGLGGGLSLARTWNSLWSSMQPVEQSGIFGDSWRSNFEERIQVLTGGLVNYWKGDGGVLFYQYNSLSGGYTMTAPTDDQTTLSYNLSMLQWTIAEKNGTQRIFNNAGYLTAIVDRNGNTTTITVDPNNQNRIASVTDAANRTLTFNYANANFPRLCTSVADAAGTVANYVYDTSGRLTQVAYADSSQFNFTYNSSNLILKVTDSQGKVIESHTYDSQRRGLTSQQANDSNGSPVNKVSVTYPTASPWATSVCDSLSDPCVSLSFTNRGQRHYLFSVAGNAVCSTCGFLGGDTYGLSPAGYKTIYSDNNNHTTVYSYDSQGNVTSKELPDQNRGDTWNYTYNGFGEVLTVTDPLGNVTTNQYDTNGNLLSTTTPSPDGIIAGSTTSFTYDSHGQLLTITDPLNNVTTLTYYPTGLVNTITDAKNSVTTYAYDARGNRASVIDASQNQTQFQYDSMNRLTQITYPDQSTVKFGYDYRGRRTSVTDQNSHVTQYAYDDADRLTSVTDASNHVTRYAYDTESRVTDIYDANNNHTQFSWINGHIYRTTFPSGYYEGYTWDGTNQYLTSKTDRIGNAVYYSYDPQNRLYQWAGSYTATYDPAGRMTQVADTSTSSTWSFAYDNMNRLTQTTSKYGFLSSRNTFTVKYGYDAASNRTSLTDPENGLTQYTYDTLNRLTNLQDFQSHNFGFSYDQLSRRTQLTRPNGVNTNYSYDNLSRLLSVLHQMGSTTLDGASYTYDAAGNRSSKTDNLASVTTNYAYDAIYQLLQATQGTTTTESYTYDAVGNRLSSLGMSPYQYNSSNELTSTPTTTYTYDKDGELATKVDSTGTTTYNWNTLNQLTSVVLPGTGGTVSFKYDPFGRRIQKSTASATTNYLYDWLRIIEEVDNGGNALARYGQGSGVDEHLSQLRAGTTSYYNQDGVGSVTSLGSSTGSLANKYTYDSFGTVTAVNGTVTNPVQYAGRELDAETGLYYYRARFYDPKAGRFLSEDPTGFLAGPNFYQYAWNQPVLYSDPTGLNPAVLTLPWLGGLGAEGAWGAAAAGGAAGLAVVGAGAAGWGIGRGIGNIPIGNDRTVDDAITDAMTSSLLWFGRRGNSDPYPMPLPTNPGREPCDKGKGRCKPCPPPTLAWAQPGNKHGATMGWHYHWIEWHQDPETCICYPKRMSGGF